MPYSPSASTQARWARELRYFRYCPSPGGHGDCPETLSASIPYRGLDALLTLFEKMRHPLRRLPVDAPRPLLGKTYTGDEWSALRHPISAWPDYEDPGFGFLLGVECHVTITGSLIHIHLSGGKNRDFWSVSAVDFRNAKAIEKALLDLGIVGIRPEWHLLKP